VIVRGIEQRKIFRSDYDRENFVGRWGKLIEETETDCFAWTLIPNHFHLLLRTGTNPLSKMMSRLLTGYAVWFNKKYHRHGQLFQNRYKSIWTALKSFRKAGIRIKGDERMLGDSDFVENVLASAEEEFEQTYSLKVKGYDFDAAAKRVAEVLSLDVSQVTSAGKSPQTVKARSLLCFWAHRKLGMTTIAISKRLGVCQSAVSWSSLRGEKLASVGKYELIE